MKPSDPRANQFSKESFYLVKTPTGWTKTLEDNSITIVPHKDTADVYNKENARKMISALRKNRVFGAKMYRMKKGLIMGDS